MTEADTNPPRGATTIGDRNVRRAIGPTRREAAR